MRCKTELFVKHVHCLNSLVGSQYIFKSIILLDYFNILNLNIYEHCRLTAQALRGRWKLWYWLERFRWQCYMGGCEAVGRAVESGKDGGGGIWGGW